MEKTTYESVNDAEFINALKEVDNACAGFMHGRVSTINVPVNTEFRLLPVVPSAEPVQDTDRQWLPIITTIGAISYGHFRGGKLQPKGVVDLYNRFGDKPLYIVDKEEAPRINGNRRFRLTISDEKPNPQSAGATA